MNSDTALIAHIKESTDRIQKFIAGFEYNSFRSDEKTVSAVVRELTVIGEAAANLSKEFREAHPDIPFYEMIGMRNRIVHGYWEIDEEVVWKTCHEDLPLLENLLSNLK